METFTTILELLAAVLFVAGVAMISVPVALMVAGVLLAGFSVLASRGDR